MSFVFIAGRKKRCDAGLPRKRKSSETGFADHDIPRKLLDDLDQSCDKSMGVPDAGSEVRGQVKDSVSDQERFRQQELSSDMRICRLVTTISAPK